MLFVKNEIDNDTLTKSLSDSFSLFPSLPSKISDENAYVLFILSNLLNNPTEEHINHLLNSNCINLFTTILKNLIKNKFLYLNCQSNIITIVNLLPKNVNESLIINLLRFSHQIDISDLKFVDSLFFKYFFGIDTQDEVFGKDYVFDKVYQYIEKQIKMGSNINIMEDQDDFEIETSFYLNYNTNKHFLVTKLNPDLELNLIYYIEQTGNEDKYYIDWLLGDLKGKEMAKDVLRYLMNVYYSTNIGKIIKIINKILEHFNYDTYLILAILYDGIFNSTDNGLVFEILKNKRVRKYLEKIVQIEFFNTKWAAFYMKFNDKNDDIEDIYQKLVQIDFNKYYKIIGDIKRGIPFISKDSYKKIIGMSYEWDGYVQVFLWKILTFQRIWYDYDVDESIRSELKSEEALEGFEIIKNIRK